MRARPSLADPSSGLTERGRQVDELRDRTRRCIGHQLDRAHSDLGHQLARVRGLSPLATLQRGYSVLQDAEGHVVTSVEQAAAGQELQARVRDGRIMVAVSDVARDTTADLSTDHEAAHDPDEETVR